MCRKRTGSKLLGNIKVHWCQFGLSDLFTKGTNSIIQLYWTLGDVLLIIMIVGTWLETRNEKSDKKFLKSHLWFILYDHKTNKEMRGELK